jgi:uncharacterized protein YabE (DUF348 family)
MINFKSIKKEYIYTGIVILIFFCTTSIFYTKWQRADVKNKIDNNKHSIKTEKATVKQIIEKQEKANDEFIDKKDSIIKEVKIIQKKKRYVTPKIKSNTHNAMLDSLWVAQPDR